MNRRTLISLAWIAGGLLLLVWAWFLTEPPRRDEPTTTPTIAVTVLPTRTPQAVVTAGPPVTRTPRPERLPLQEMTPTTRVPTGTATSMPEPTNTRVPTPSRPMEQKG